MTDPKHITVVVEEPLKSMLEEAQPIVEEVFKLLKGAYPAPGQKIASACLWVAARIMTNTRRGPIPASAFEMMAGVVHHVESNAALGHDMVAIMAVSSKKDGN